MNVMVPNNAMCSCGSGLQSDRCCDLDSTYVVPFGAHAQLAHLITRAAEALSTGHLLHAETICCKVLNVAPRAPNALWILYQVRTRSNQRQAALVLLHRLVSLDPNHLEATQELATILFQNGELATAEQYARNAVRLAPTHPRSHNLMGMILTEAHRPQIGEFHYRRMLELSGERDPILLANLAWNLKCQGRIDEARQLYQESVAAAPGVFQTWFGWAQLEEADRNFAAAKSRLDRAAEIDPDNASLPMARAVLLSRQGDCEAALSELRPVGSRDTVFTERPDPNALLLKGRLLDRLTRYDEAFGCFVAAKQLARETSKKAYLESEANDMAERLQQFFVRGRLRLFPPATVRADFPQPIFILGFPRSGTTLVEQSLSAHPRISAGDELPFVNEFTESLPRLLGSPLRYPEALAEIWMGDNRGGLNMLRDSYLEKAESRKILREGSRWFTDKMPLNEMHMGLISLIFPRSPLIHIIRHPLDVVLSVFSYQMTHGFLCSYQLETIARHYVLMSDIVQHYRQEMALKYLPIRYEDIVGDVETSVRRILEFINEPFDERCVNLAENRRLPQTPSYADVAENVHDRARLRYRHYLKYLEPVVPILEPVIELLGYSVERSHE